MKAERRDCKRRNKIHRLLFLVSIFAFVNVNKSSRSVEVNKASVGTSTSRFWVTTPAVSSMACIRQFRKPYTRFHFSLLRATGRWENERSRSDPISSRAWFLPTCVTQISLGETCTSLNSLRSHSRLNASANGDASYHTQVVENNSRPIISRIVLFMVQCHSWNKISTNDVCCHL